MLSASEQTAGTWDRFNSPLYYSAEVAKFAHINPSRVRRWLRGYDYDYEAKHISQPPVMRIIEEDYIRSSYASFNDLVDLLFIKDFLRQGVSLQKVRRALNEARELLGTQHFAHQIFFTDGKNICMKLGDKGDAILELLSGGQWVIKDVIIELAHQIDFDSSTKYARRWFPPQGDQLVVLDPMISFGKPSVWKKGITTENILDLYLAEGERIEAVSKWMDLEDKEVVAAIKFESSLAS